jgi:hypothetical protein
MLIASNVEAANCPFGRHHIRATASKHSTSTVKLQMQQTASALDARNPSHQTNAQMPLENCGMWIASSAMFVVVLSRGTNSPSTEESPFISHAEPQPPLGIFVRVDA